MNSDDQILYQRKEVNDMMDNKDCKCSCHEGMDCCMEHKMSKEHLEAKKEMLKKKLEWVDEQLEKVNE